MIILVIIYITFISLGLPDSLLGAAWSVMRGDFSAGLDSAGVISFIIVGGTVISALASDRVIKKFGAPAVTAVSVLLTAAALLGFALGDKFHWLIISAVPLGIGAGAVDAALNNYVALYYKAKHMNWLHCFWGVGAFVGPAILSAFLRQNGNWRGGYLTVSIVQFSVAALLFATLPLWKKQNKMPPLPQEEEISPPPALTLKKALQIKGVGLAVAIFILYCGAEYIVGLWSGSFLSVYRGFSPQDAALGSSLFYLGITAGRLLSGFLAAKMSADKMIAAGLCLIFPGAILLLFPLPAPVYYVALFSIGMGCAPVFPAMLHQTPVRFGSENSQKIVGLQMAAAYAGSAAVPPLLGVLASGTTLLVIPVCLLAFAAAMLLCHALLIRKLKNLPL